MPDDGHAGGPPSDLETVRGLLQGQTGSGGMGLLTTASGEGVPHATWMGTIMAPRWDQLATITSPDSRKVANIKANPSVEWLFSSANRTELVYLEGQAEIVTEPREIKRYWKALPDKGRAFFLLYFNSGLGFCILRTWIEHAVLCVPAEYRKVRFSVEELQP